MLSKKQFLAYWDGGMVGGDREKWGWAVMFMQRGTCWPQPKLGKAKLYVHLVISPFDKKNFLFLTLISSAGGDLLPSSRAIKQSEPHSPVKESHHQN